MRKAVSNLPPFEVLLIINEFTSIEKQALKVAPGLEFVAVVVGKVNVVRWVGRTSIHTREYYATAIGR